MALIATAVCLFVKCLEGWYVILLGERIVEGFVQDSESVIDFVGLFEIHSFLIIKAHFYKIQDFNRSAKILQAPTGTSKIDRKLLSSVST